LKKFIVASFVLVLSLLFAIPTFASPAITYSNSHDPSLTAHSYHYPTYSSGWVDYASVSTYTDTMGAWFTIPVTGISAVDLYFNRTGHGGRGDVYIDNVLIGQINQTTVAGNPYYAHITGISGNVLKVVHVDTSDQFSLISIYTGAPPPMPGNLTGTTENEQVTLNWTASTGATGYKIYKDNVFLASTTSATSYIATGLTKGKNYTFEVTSTNSLGESPRNSTNIMLINTTPPAVPSSLSGTAGYSIANLYWTANSEIDLKGYNVYKNGIKVNLSPITNNIYGLTALTNGTIYSFTLTAINTSGYESTQTAAINIMPINSTPPAYPTGLTGTAGLNQVDLQWTANTESDIQGYNIFQGSTKLNIGTITGTSFHVDGLTNAQTYPFTVSAINTSGVESTRSVIKYLTPLNNVPPAVPIGFTATTGDTQIFLTWTVNAESDIQGYYVYHFNTRVTSSPITGTAVTVTGLTNGSSYPFTVTAINTSGFESAKSEIQSAIPEPPPAVPQGLTATVGDSKITLNWTANTETNLKGYFIFRDGSKLNATPIIGTSYVSTGLTNYTGYTYTISAIDVDGYESVKSDPVLATPVDLTPPAVPTGITGSAGNAQATLHWTANTESDLRGYNIYQGTTKLNGSPITGTSFTANALSNGTSYGFAISSVDIAGNESAQSATITIKPMAVQQPTGLTALNDLENAKVILAWDTPAQPAITYIIYRDGVQIGTSVTPAYTDTTITSGENYSYDVLAVDTIGNQSNKSNVKSYFSKSATDFSTGGTGFSASDVVRNAGSFLFLFVGLIVLIASIRFAPQLQNFFFLLLNVIKNNGVLKQSDKYSKRSKVDIKTIKETNVLKPLKRGFIQKIDRSKKIKEAREPTLKEAREPRSPKVKITTIQKRNYDQIHNESVKKRAGRSVVKKIKRKRGFST
jgi:hypothetical protein